MALLTLNGGGVTSILAIPNDSTVVVPGLLLDHASAVTTVVSVTTVRVASAPSLVNANKYVLVCHYIDAAWIMIQNAIDFDLGGWDGLTWSISAVGQIQFTSDLMPGTYDLAQSKMLYKIAIKG